MVAVGGHYKNAVAVAAGQQAFISQHIGDLETTTSAEAFREVLTSVQALYHVTPEMVVADLHPDYVSTQHARRLSIPMAQVQHHYAHVASCMAENDLDGEVLGVSWDGTGYGEDGTVWGGEFLVTDDDSFRRAGMLGRFPLPGGEAAVREPRRSALGVLSALAGADAFSQPVVVEAFGEGERRVLRQALDRGVNSPLTSSAGRLFDAVAALIGLRWRASYEGQAAFELECAVDDSCDDSYPFELDTALSPFVLDWKPMIRAILDDVSAGVARGMVATRFHNTLASMIVAAAVRVGEPRVVLTGGCFQNRALTERAVMALVAAGFKPYWHQRVPPNDGGLALGQIAAVLRKERSRHHVPGSTRQNSGDRGQRPVVAIGQS
jgi:hydrogenase maturation protein HypF